MQAPTNLVPIPFCVSFPGRAERAGGRAPAPQKVWNQTRHAPASSMHDVQFHEICTALRLIATTHTPALT